MLNPRSLFDLCLTLVCIELEDGNDLEKLSLPMTVKRRARSVIKQLWFNTYCNLYSEPEIESKTIYHIIQESYLWNLSNRSFHVCEACFIDTTRLTKDLALSRWGECNGDWQFYHEIKHSRLNSNLIFENIVEKKEHYCDLCLVAPLFKILNRAECMSEYEYHDRRRTKLFESYDDSDCSSESNDSDPDYEYTEVTRMF